jgi:hypothetical protein
LRAGVYRHLGFASFTQYVGELFGYKPRSIEEKLRVAEALQVLPLLSEDLRAGTLAWSTVRELTRVATRDTESLWREMAQGKSAREIEDRISGRKPGDTPDSTPDPRLRRHVLSFEVRAETLATFREAVAKLRRDSGGPLDEDASLLLMARQVLGGKTDGGRANYQLAFTVCEHCERAFQHGRGELLEVERAVADMARCDAQYVGRVGSLGASLGSRETSVHVAAHVGGVPNHHAGSTRIATSGVESSDLSAKSGTSAHTAPGKVAHVARPNHPAQLPSRATQTIPPATRRFVLRRYGERCVVPGCRHATFLDVHHLDQRSEGGGHDLESLVVLCAAHHRAIHRGALIVEGRPSHGLVFRHADGSLYRTMVSPRSVAAQTKAFEALRRMGFREGEVRRALNQLRNEIGLDGEDPQQVLRAALRLLTPVSGTAATSDSSSMPAPVPA